MQPAKFILVNTWHSFLSDFNNLTRRQLELILNINAYISENFAVYLQQLDPQQQ